MGKAPAFQFYVKDWLSDPELQCVSASSRGIWIDALCYMWQAPERGRLSGTQEELSKLLRATNGDFIQFLEDIKRHQFCDVTNRDNELTLINRRMYREQKLRENHTLRQQRYIKRQKNDKEMTLPSPSPSPKTIPDDIFLTQLKAKFPWVDFDRELSKIDAWLLVNPQRKKTRRFIVSWMSRIDKPMESRMDDKPKEYFKG